MIGFYDQVTALLDELIRLHGWSDGKDDGIFEALGIRSFQHGLIKILRLLVTGIIYYDLTHFPNF